MIFFLVVVLVLTVLFLWWRQESQLPPGPLGLPIVGYFPFLSSNGMVKVQKLAQKYGSIMKLSLLNENIYFLNSFEAINEAFGNQGDNFAGRAINEFNMINFIHGKKALNGAEGENWKIQKKFMLNKLTTLGMGKADFGYVIHDICDDLINYIKEEKELNNLHLYLSNFTSNVISKILYGEKYSPNDPVYKQLVENIAKFMGTGDNLVFICSGNVTAALLKSNRKIWNGFVDSLNGVMKFMYERIKDRFESDRPNEELNDILDYCIKESKGPNSALFDKKTIVRNYVLMFVAGTETTASTLHFAIYFMATNPEVQRKVYNEIIDVFGREYRLLFTEASKLNYTRAVIAEIQRVSCILALGLVHVNREEAIVCGYRFPKRSKFVANMYSLSRNKQYFKNPDVFDPNNFLGDDGNYTPIEANMPFGIGTRMCLGFKLAQMELFIAFTRLIQEFEWLPPHDEKIKFEVREGLVRQLSPYKIIARKRC